MFGKPQKKRLNALQKAEAVARLIESPSSFIEWSSKLTAQQLRELRDLFKLQVKDFSAATGASLTTDEAVEGRFEPIPNYFHKQYCREPLEACYNETCLTSNPGCFSKKIRGQIQVLTDILRPMALKSSSE